MNTLPEMFLIFLIFHYFSRPEIKSTIQHTTPRMTNHNQPIQQQFYPTFLSGSKKHIHLPVANLGYYVVPLAES